MLWLLGVSIAVALLPWYIVAVAVFLAHPRQAHWEILLPLIATDIWFGASESFSSIPVYTAFGTAGLLFWEMVRPRLMISKGVVV
ncbi:hypothetical protein D6792_01795 [Candidatus Parcubacteria bacterium]|jgi:hypothetical protein|nr:MAG: hypothetical protein D6792_01795 [Candidatus Parcubacteria bacterium]